MHSCTCAHSWQTTVVTCLHCRTRNVLPWEAMTPSQTETRSPHFNREENARTYRDIHLPRVFTPWARILLEVAPPRVGDAVLDVATGPGTVARQAALLVGPSGRVVGVDFSAAILAVGR